MPESSSNKLRRTMHFSGNVQGVGFRYTARAVASRFEVAGYVRNLPDGRVELVAEGEKDEVTRFQQAVARAMNGYISHTTQADSPPTGEFTSFSIAR